MRRRRSAASGYWSLTVHTKAERDSDGDAVIDQWWEFTQHEKCPLIHSDVEGDA